ncbi:Nramp family divalent metal transporter [Peterkaempfera griseoplana]|uniref:Nramp family divalent metal transporter n=1 Tax=Peterkaempfera griseoplana TaxID=66896 RepID=UPI0006E13A16
MTTLSPTPDLQLRRTRAVRFKRCRPAFVAAIAYVDPGNVVTNMTAGARYGTNLLWVVVLATVIAGPVQYLAAKLGATTGRSLPQLIAGRYSPPRRLTRQEADRAEEAHQTARRRAQQAAARAEEQRRQLHTLREKD